MVKFRKIEEIEFEGSAERERELGETNIPPDSQGHRWGWFSECTVRNHKYSIPFIQL